jgi:hypothetical protein
MGKLGDRLTENVDTLRLQSLEVIQAVASRQRALFALSHRSASSNGV